MLDVASELRRIAGEMDAASARGTAFAPAAYDPGILREAAAALDVHVRSAGDVNAWLLNAARHLDECDFHPVMSAENSCSACRGARAVIAEAARLYAKAGPLE